MVADLLRAAIEAAVELVVVEALEAAEQAVQGVVLAAEATAPVEADAAQLVEASVAIADVDVEEACSEGDWRAPSPGRSQSRSIASILLRARLPST
jgi:hypothetical protein